ncbi:hypothetical protein niasHS_007553 [Heterodera schachtii]|uniref:Uncharacterized protein n=1 Tax=Heterodera schachtii TaxID=97005 RepID=A0ABD2JYI7_HETSC
MPDIPEVMSSSDRLSPKRRRRRKVTQRQSDQRTTAVERRSAVVGPQCRALLPPSSLFSLLLLLCAIPAIVFSSSVNCPQWVNDEIQQCVQPVADFAKTLNREQQQQTDEEAASSSASSHAPVQSAEFGQALQWPTKMGGQVFRELCRLINEFEQCVKVFRQKCRRHITISLIEASYGFLCNEGYETFMASAECLMELDQRPNVKRCHDRTLKSIEAANGDGEGAVDTKLDKMCSALNYFSDCVRMPIRQSCGAKAWQVIFRVLKDTTRTLMPKCEFEERSEMEEKGESGQKEEEEERMWTNNGGRRTNGWAETAAEQAEGRREAETNGGRGNAMARHNAKTMPKTTTADPFDGWEQWEEEGNGGKTDRRKQTEGEMHHQIHYGSQPSRNGATPPALSLFLYSLPFLLSFFTSFSTKI